MESAITFNVAQEQLLGIVSCPDNPQSIAVLILVGGPQYRVGSHRQFVLLARQLAHHGIASMRFDYRGMGDSTGEHRTFEQIEEDIQAAIDALCASCPAAKGIVIWGLCDAASAAMMHGWSDPRIKGMILLNPWIRSEVSLAKAYLRHYYISRLLDPAFWRKLSSGTFSPVSSAKSLAKNIAQGIGHNKSASTSKPSSMFQTRMLEGLEKFSGNVLVILSGMDITAQEFSQWVDTQSAWKIAMSNSRLTTERLPTADHTFSADTDRTDVERLTASFIATKVTS